MADIHIRKEGVAGRITLDRPDALNALTHAMVGHTTRALADWRDDHDVQLLVIDAVGERAFCAGGDVTAIYAAAKAGDYDGPRQFWREEYQMNADLFAFPKPIVSFLQGFTMGGGVGVGCHASHRIVGQSAQIAMPECGIGLVPDVGGSLILAQAPGRLGEYLATTAARMGPADAVLAGFADYYVPEADWPALKAKLIKDGDLSAIEAASRVPPEGALNALRPTVDRNFAGEGLGDIVRALRFEASPFAEAALRQIARNSPLSMACAVEMIHRLRGSGTIGRALELEYRFTHRAMERGDFVEGVRAAIIDKDRAPKWRHAGPEAITAADISGMLMPLGADGLKLEGARL